MGRTPRRAACGKIYNFARLPVYRLAPERIGPDCVSRWRHCGYVGNEIVGLHQMMRSGTLLAPQGNGGRTMRPRRAASAAVAGRPPSEKGVSRAVRPVVELRCPVLVRRRHSARWPGQPVAGAICRRPRSRRVWQRLFLACLTLVGVTSLVSMGISTASWLFSAAVLALMAVGAVWDLGGPSAPNRTDASPARPLPFLRLRPRCRESSGISALPPRAAGTASRQRFARPKEPQNRKKAPQRYNRQPTSIGRHCHGRKECRRGQRSPAAAS